MKVGDLVRLNKHVNSPIYKIVKLINQDFDYGTAILMQVYNPEHYPNIHAFIEDIVLCELPDETWPIDTIPIKLDNGARMPEKAHETDAGFDLFAPRDCDFIDGECVIDTGVHIAIPRGYVGYIQGRSGLNMRKSIICPTGTVDSGYTGSIKVKLYNLSFSHYAVKAGDKIAQLVIQPIAQCGLVRVDSLENTERGDGGFGSTGR